MTIGKLVSEQERAIATVAQCGLELRQAQEHARRASELSRRAVREVEGAAGALEDAARRLDRMDQSIQPKGVPMTDLGEQLDTLTDEARIAAQKSADAAKSAATTLAHKAHEASEAALDELHQIVKVAGEKAEEAAERTKTALALDD